MGEINYLLAAVLIVMLVGILIGYRRGFLRLAVSFVGLILVIIIVTKLSPVVSDYFVNNTEVYNDVKSKIITLYYEKNHTDGVELLEDQNLAIQSYELPELISAALISNNNSEMYNLLAASLFEEYIAGYLARVCIKAGSFVGLFVALAIILFIVKSMIKVLEKIPVLKSINRFFGMVTGLSISVILIWVFFIGTMIFFMDSMGNWVIHEVNRSSVLTYLFNSNMLLKMLLK